jgi:hypothetical protein
MKRVTLAVAVLVLPLAARAQLPAPVGADVRNHLQQIDAHLQDATRQARILVEGSERAPDDWARIKTEASRDLGRALAAMREHLERIHRLPDHRIAGEEAFRQLERQLAFAEEDYRELRHALDEPNRQRVHERATTMYQTLRETDEAFTRLADAVGVPRVEPR